MVGEGLSVTGHVLARAVTRPSQRVAAAQVFSARSAAYGGVVRPMSLGRAAAGSEVSATPPKPSPDGVWFAGDSTPPVRGFLHTPGAPSGDALVLTHGAGSDCQSPLLVAVATAFAEGGFTVLRCDLPYRQKRRHGPPFRGEDRLDREGLRNAVAALSELDCKPHRVLLGGHSYGGR